MTVLAIAPTTALVDLHVVADEARAYIEASKAESTKRAYTTDWNHFTSWCEERQLVALPAAPETVALYLTDCARRYKVATLQRRMAAISQAHQAAQHDSPSRSIAVRAVMAGIRRKRGTAQEAKTAAVKEDLQAMLDTLPDTLLGKRDRALLLIGFAGAFRRSELVGLDRGDVDIKKIGLVLTIRHSKTDQYAQGQVIGIPKGLHKATCPVRALEAWLTAAGIVDGPIFRSVNRHGQVQSARLSDKAVALVVKRCAEAAGLDPDVYAGHSLRSGLATSAAAAGASERKIMAQTRHRSTAMVRRYIQEGELFKDNAAGGLGL